MLKLLTVLCLLVPAYAQWQSNTTISGDIDQMDPHWVDGRPAIAYSRINFITLTQDLFFVRANDAEGTTWPAQASHTLLAAGHFAETVSMLTVNGRPAIAYYNATGAGGQLRYVRANDAQGNSWPAPVILDAAGDVGTAASMFIVNGNPAIFYYDKTNDRLKYIAANDANGTSWGTPIIVDAFPTVSSSTYNQNRNEIGVAVVNGNPAACYHAGDLGQLRFVRADFPSGQGNWTGTIVDPNGTLNDQIEDLEIVEGRPAIAYVNETSGELFYTRANDANGSSWGTPLSLSNVGNIGTDVDLIVIDTIPHIAYQNEVSGSTRALELIKAQDRIGSAWCTPEEVLTTAPISFNGPEVFLNDTTFYIITNAGFSSNLPIFRKNRSLAPTLGPVAGPSLACDHAILSWTAVTNAIGYDVQVSENADYSNPVALAAAQAGTSYMAANLMPTTPYFYRVRALFACDQPSLWAEGTFITPDAGDGPPLNPASVSCAGVSLSWIVAVGAATYDIQISDNASFTPILEQQLGMIQTGYQPSFSFVPGTQYHYRVRNSSVCGPTNWSTATFVMPGATHTIMADLSQVQDFCENATPPNLLIQNTNGSLTYQLLDAGNPIGAAQSGNGGTLSFAVPATVGTHSLGVRIDDSGCSTDTLFNPAVSYTVAAVPAPFTILSAPQIAQPITTLQPLEVAFSADTPGAYTWDFGDGSSGTGQAVQHTYAPGTYTLTATKAGGLCGDIVRQRTITILPEDITFTMPNVFSPNGDGVNDRFIFAPPISSTITFQVYNRWGQQVLNVPKPEWNGTVDNSGADAPEGVYVYVLKLRLTDGRELDRTGTITLLR